MNKFILIMALSIQTAFAADAALEGKNDTKLESFQAKTGAVIIKGYTTVGVVRGGYGSLTVDARDYRDASNPKSKITGVSITVTESGRIERENTASIDADEIDSLIAGIDYISKATKDVTAQTNFEIQYKTKGNFKITIFNNSKGEISAAVSAGNIGKTNVFVSMEQLMELRKLVLDAKAKL